MLASLLEHSGHLVTREELRQRLWGDEVFVDFDNSLNITAIAALSSEQFGVIARTTAMRYKGCRKNVEQIGHELAVNYVVEGAVLRTEVSCRGVSDQG